MPFTIPTLDELRDVLLAALQGRLPLANIGQRSDNYKRKSVIAFGILDNHYFIRQVGLDLFPDSAEGGSLDRHGAIWGVTRKAASGSSGASALRVFGSSGSTVPVSEAMTHLPSGLAFETTSGGLIPAAGFLDVSVSALSTGAQTNLEVGQELTFDVTPAGLEDNAAIIVELDNGLDAELDDAYRARVLNRIGKPAMGGNRNDYAQWALESDAFVDSAYVYPNRNGLGTVDVVVLKAGSGAARLPSAGERTTVLTYLDTVRPVSATVRVLEVTGLAVDVEATIFPEDDPQYAFDWNDVTPPEVLTYVAGTRTVTFSAARPSDMAVGDRIVIDASGSLGEEYLIESLSGTDAVVLTEALAFTPVATDKVYSGGPLVGSVRANIKALIDALGSANPTDTPYGPWEGNLRLSKLFEAIQTTTGVLDSVLVDPVANVEADDPSFPDNDSVELLTPGKLIARKDPTAP